MRLFKHISISILSALVVSSAGLFAVGGNVHAQEANLPPVLKVDAPLATDVPEAPQPEKPVEPVLKVDVLKEKVPVIEEKHEVVTQTSTNLQKTAEELQAIETQKQALAIGLDAKKAEIEALKAKVEQKKQAEAARVQLASAPKVSASNPNGCDLNTQWVRADNLQCKNKPGVAQAGPAPVQTPTVRPAPRVQLAAATPNLYEVGQCTWHVKNLKPELPNRLGNADKWYANAQARGLATGTVARPGAAAPRKTGMHVVYVREVYANGTMLVDEMNYNYIPHSQRTAIKNQADFYYIY